MKKRAVVWREKALRRLDLLELVIRHTSNRPGMNVNRAAQWLGALPSAEKSCRNQRTDELLAGKTCPPIGSAALIGLIPPGKNETEETTSNKQDRKNSKKVHFACHSDMRLFGRVGRHRAPRSMGSEAVRQMPVPEPSLGKRIVEDEAPMTREKF